MSSTRQTRRHFLKWTAASTAVSAPYFFTTKPSWAARQDKGSKNDRPILGCIGTGSRWGGVGPSAMQFSDCVAVCDVDKNHLAGAQKRVRDRQGRDAEGYEDYRRVLDRKDIDVITIVTPDHWHTKIAIEAMQAGKDVYCEKPLTLTIDEGKQILKVLRETGRVFQVGTQQRSEMGLRFLQAIAVIREGRIGDIRKVTCAIGGAPESGPIATAKPPAHLNWEKWLGQAPLVDYRYEKKGSRSVSRCHYEFRWWYEYSGGKMTDWGAHHVDIAQWGIDQIGQGQGPTRIDPISFRHPVEMRNGQPTDPTQYNCATAFKVKCTFADDVEMFIQHDAPELGFNNGIMFEGTKGRFLVNRGKIVGKPIEALADKPLDPETMVKVYRGKQPGGGNAHMRNFFDCIKTREQPISDVASHHRAMTTCHLANIAIRLGRPLTWNPEAEQIDGDAEARSFQRRTARKGYEIDVQVD